MASSADCRDDSSAHEDGRPPLLKKRTEQVSCLPFSVEALMSDKRPCERLDGAAVRGNYSFKSEEKRGAEEFSQHFVPVKSEPTDRGDCASWISHVTLSTPPRK